MSTTNTVNTVALKALLSDYAAADERVADLEAQIEVAKSEQGAIVARLAETGAKTFTFGGRQMSVVVGGGKSRNSNFIRGWREAKATKAAPLNLDA